MLLVFSLILFMGSCKQKENATKSDSKQVADKIDRVQAILKVQPVEYDPNDANKITGEYIAKQQMTIPKALSAQNKWIMFEGPVLENDKVGYRYYADYRHRFDIFGKSVSDLVMDTVSWQYHDLMNWGSDILKVGSSLGIGSPAILYQDSIYALEKWDKKTIEILNDTDELATIRTTFHDLVIGDERMTIQQDWSLAAGGYDCTIDLKRLDGKLPIEMKFATGIVSHLEESKESNTAEVYYSYTWGNQSFHKQDLGMAIIADQKYGPTKRLDPMSHITVFDNSQDGVVYKFMAVWADGVGDIKTEESFIKSIEEIVTKL